MMDWSFVFQDCDLLPVTKLFVLSYKHTEETGKKCINGKNYILLTIKNQLKLSLLEISVAFSDFNRNYSDKTHLSL